MPADLLPRPRPHRFTDPMHLRFRPMLPLPLLLAAACSVSDPSVLDPLRDAPDLDMGFLEEDAPMDTPDMPGDIRAPSNACADSTAFEISDVELGLTVDTSGATNDVNVDCAASAGNDRFFILDVEGGEVWHFHLSVAGSGSSMDPVLYLLEEQSDRCNERECVQIANFCSGTSDEHFAFIAPSSGKWYVGVDSATEGGAIFNLDAFKPECGNGEKEHGETCDESDTSASQCERCLGCRCVLSPALAQRMEHEPNDNLHEANLIDLDGMTETTVTGTIGGSTGCAYPDFFAIDIEDQEDLAVSLVNGAGTPCDADNPVNLDLTLRSSTGRIILPGSDDANGCSRIDGTDLASGRYMIEVSDPTGGQGGGLQYRLALVVAP